MKKTFYILAIAVFGLTSCTKNTDAIESTEITKTTTENPYLDNAKQSLSVFESSLQTALKKSKNYSEFELGVNNDIEMKSALQRAKQSAPTEFVLNDVEGAIMRDRIEYLSKQIASFDTTNVYGSKAEFLLFLDQQEEFFAIDANAIEKLSKENKQILIAQAAFKIGIIRVMIDNSDAIDALASSGNVSVVKNGRQNSISSCNWWCRNRIRIQCIGLTAGSVACFGSIVGACVPCLVACSGFATIAMECWKSIE